MAFIEHKGMLQEKHPLRYLLWEPTLRCNLECLHCSNECTTENTSRLNELTTEEIKNELSSIAMHYDPKEITFVVTGGEPLMRHDLTEVGAFASSLGYQWSITTNGLLLNKNTIRSLKEAHLGSIAVSLDGIEEHHDKLRNSQGAYRRTVENIRRFLASDNPATLSILCCVSSINVHHLGEFVKELMDIGVRRVRFGPIYGAGRAQGELMLSDEELLKLLVFIREERVRQRNRIDISLSDDGYYGAEFECHVRRNLHYCGAGIEWGAILYDGCVSGSTNISRKYNEGNIRNDSFVDIWENRFDRYRRGRETLFAPYCADCEEWILCEGGGFHLLDQYLNGTQECGYKKIRSAYGR